MKTKKRLTKAERENRDGMTRKAEWAQILVIRRLIEAGWSNRQLVNTWATMRGEIERLVAAHCRPDHSWCDEVEVANIVTEMMMAAKFTPWGEVIA